MIGGDYCEDFERSGVRSGIRNAVFNGLRFVAG